MAVDTIRQCPCCELRFANRNELDDHLRTDHITARPDDVPSASPVVAGTVAVPVDPTRAQTLAVPIAATLARQAGMGIEIVAAPPRWLPTANAASSVREARSAGAPRVQSVVLAPTDHPAAAIAEHIRRVDAALVCMATSGRSLAGDLVLGSVSAAVVRSSPVPVLLVGPGVRTVAPRVGRLVACLDGSDIAERALPVAAELAQRLTAEFILIRVATDGRVVGTDLSDLAYLHDAAEHLPGPPPLIDVLHDRHPVEAIAAYGGDRGDTVTVMATHGRSGLRGVLMGSVARGVTHAAKCPVVVVPPSATARALARSGASRARGATHVRSRGELRGERS
jgi:nucleotide-binding universal stress UspA family protein